MIGFTVFGNYARSVPLLPTPYLSCLTIAFEPLGSTLGKLIDVDPLFSLYRALPYLEHSPSFLFKSYQHLMVPLSVPVDLF